MSVFLHFYICPGVRQLASVRELQESQQLILLLLGHELDRIVTWANPLVRRTVESISLLF